MSTTPNLDELNNRLRIAKLKLTNALAKLRDKNVLEAFITSSQEVQDRVLNISAVLQQAADATRPTENLHHMETNEENKERAILEENLASWFKKVVLPPILSEYNHKGLLKQRESPFESATWFHLQALRRMYRRVQGFDKHPVGSAEHGILLQEWLNTNWNEGMGLTADFESTARGFGCVNYKKDTMEEGGPGGLYPLSKLEDFIIAQAYYQMVKLRSSEALQLFEERLSVELVAPAYGVALSLRSYYRASLETLKAQLVKNGPFKEDSFFYIQRIGASGAGMERECAQFTPPVDGKFSGLTGECDLFKDIKAIAVDGQVHIMATAPVGDKNNAYRLEAFATMAGCSSVHTGTGANITAGGTSESPYWPKLNQKTGKVTSRALDAALALVYSVGFAKLNAMAAKDAFEVIAKVNSILASNVEEIVASLNDGKVSATVSQLNGKGLECFSGAIAVTVDDDAVAASGDLQLSVLGALFLILEICSDPFSTMSYLYHRMRCFQLKGMLFWRQLRFI